MSDKLSGLDKLIMEMMLQEKEFGVPRDWKNPKDIFGNDVNKIDPKPYKALPNQRAKKDEWVAAIKAIAKMDNKPSNITDKDVRAAMAAPLTTSTKGNPNKASSRRKYVANAIAPALNVKQQSDLEDSELSMKADIGKKLPYDAEEQDFSVPAVDLDYFRSSPKDPSDEWSKLTPSSKIDPSIKDVFEGFFEDFKASTIEKRFESLDEFSNLIHKVAGGDPTALDELNKYSPEKIMNTAIVVKTLAKLTKELHGDAAGTVFETFLSLLLGGIIGGGTGGAGDVTLLGAEEIKLSAKLYQDKPGGGQSVIGLTKEMLKKGQPWQKSDILWYIAGAKITKKNLKEAIQRGQDWIQVNLHISGVKIGALPQGWDWGQPETQTSVGFDFYSKDGVKINSSPVFAKYEPNSNLKIRWKDRPDYKIKLALSSGAGSEHFDKMFTAAVDKLNSDVGELVEAIKGVYEKTNLIQKGTQSFVAKNDVEAGLTVRDSYITLFDHLKSLFQGISSPDQSIAPPRPEDLQENKKNLLDKLIEEVILSTTTEE